MKKKTKLMLGDNMESLKKLPDNSVDSVVTDGPYGISFMNRKWDYEVPSVEFWKEVYRVLKPGGHILSFGGTRTYHRMTVNIEDAGFEIRDQIMWLYGSGFPKSHNIGKAVDKLQGNVREVIGEYEVSSDFSKHNGSMMSINNTDEGSNKSTKINQTKGQSDWEGWGTAMKPSVEPICVARKPLSEKSVALNVLKWGTGGINIDGCRVKSFNDDDMKQANKPKRVRNNSDECLFPFGSEPVGELNTEGRFPANIILECICDEVIKVEKGEVIEHNGTGGIWSEGTKEPVGRTYNDKGDIHTNPMCPCYMMDEQSGVLKGDSPNRKPRKGGHREEYVGTEDNNVKNQIISDKVFSDKGGASRFFYQAKVSKAERNMGLDGFEEKEVTKTFDGVYNHNKEKHNKVVKNNHPTVKPVNLMAYLCRLVTPPNGIVLDPYMGSGATGIAAQLEGFRFVGMELDEDYFKIAEARIENFEKYRKFIKK